MRCIPRRDAARAHRLVPAGRGGGEHEGSGRQRALLAGSSLMTRPLALVIRDEPALAAQALVHDKVQAPSSAPPRPAPETALLWCRHGALRAPGVQNGGDQPGHHAARHPSTPKAHRKHAKKLSHRMVSWSYPGHRGFNPLRFGHIRPEAGDGPKQGFRGAVGWRESHFGRTTPAPDRNSCPSGPRCEVSWVRSAVGCE